MSQIAKRLEKKISQIGAVQMDKAQILAFKKETEEKLNEANSILAQIEEFEQQIVNYAKKNNTEVSVVKHQLIDGSEIDVFVVQYDRTVIVSALGLVGKSKAHPNDDFNFELGYELALHRFMDQYLYILCNQEQMK